jgi:dTDP-4-amino-4,6-dideoxygalactose transaminase
MQPPAPTKPIGGFFELHEADGASGGASVLDAWAGHRAHVAFVNARSAFAGLARQFPATSIWLPAFSCTDLLDGLDMTRVKFYPLRDGFQPDLDVLGPMARSGDLVLVTAYFGQPATAATRNFAAGRPDLWIVEDCAQALDPGALWSHWRLFSPRKLFGVADGGILVVRDQGGFLPAPERDPDAAGLWAAHLLRHADPEGLNNAAWHAANQQKERGMTAAPEAISRRSLDLLSRTSLQSLRAPRLRNWQILDKGLRTWSALPSPVTAPPLGYVIRVPSSGRGPLLAKLYAERIFAAVHWAEIAGPAHDFPLEQQWSRELVTLPCDHRYGEAEMDRIVARVASLLQ